MENINLEFLERESDLDKFWRHCMLSLIKSTVLSVGFLAGLAAAANAQSVSALPPDGGTPPSYGGTSQVQNARTGIAGSTQSTYPKPGGGAVWKEDHYQPSAQSATGAYPYTNGAG